jgi:hypothetical protein
MHVDDHLLNGKEESLSKKFKAELQNIKQINAWSLLQVESCQLWKDLHCCQYDKLEGIALEYFKMSSIIAGRHQDTKHVFRQARRREMQHPEGPITVLWLNYTWTCQLVNKWTPDLVNPIHE